MLGVVKTATAVHRVPPCCPFLEETNEDLSAEDDAMSNQTHTDRVKDAGKRRREYVRKLAIALSVIALVCVIGAFAVPAAMAATILAMMLMPKSLSDGVRIPLAVLATIGIPTFVLLRVILLYRSQVDKARGIAYVPPVAEQIAALPAESILVRGSEQPAAQPEELLRAAQSGAETEAGELLRAGSKP